MIYYEISFPLTHIFKYNFVKILLLKELRNRIVRNILVWSLFFVTRLYVRLHFLRFLLEN